MIVISGDGTSCEILLEYQREAYATRLACRPHRADSLGPSKSRENRSNDTGLERRRSHNLCFRDIVAICSASYALIEGPLIRMAHRKFIFDKPKKATNELLTAANS
jgi:hypothetical protein